MNSGWINNIRIAGHCGMHRKPLKRSSVRMMAEKRKPCGYSMDSSPIWMVQYWVTHSQKLAKISARYHHCADNIHDAENENLARRSDFSLRGLKNTEKRMNQLDSKKGSVVLILVNRR